MENNVIRLVIKNNSFRRKPGIDYQGEDFEIHGLNVFAPEPLVGNQVQSTRLLLWSCAILVVVAFGAGLIA